MLNSIRRIDRGEIRTEDGYGIDTTVENLQLYRDKAGQMAAALTDHHLVESYQGTDGEAGDPFGDALLAEIERRNLGI